MCGNSPCRPMTSTCTWSARFRIECLARHVAGMSSVRARRDWLAAFRARHGELAATELEALVRSEWGKTKNNGRATR